MIHGIGVDLIEVRRIKKSILKFGNRFKNRICTQRELKIVNSFDSNNIESIHFKHYTFFAKRFAAKEAFAKALGFGIGKKVQFHSMEVLNDKFGKPYIVYHPVRSTEATNQYKIHLSISDTKEYATAYVVIEKIL